jgi:two-component system, cell cycle response regulator DivK
MAVAPVLILSEDVDTQDLYVVALRWRRRAAYGVATLRDALALARETRLSAIVVDVRCDDDWRACQRLRRNTVTREVPLVALTGYIAADGRFRRRAARVGCAAFIAKPTLPDTVAAVIDRVIDGEHGIEVMQPVT